MPIMMGYVSDESARTTDTDGRLHIARSHISKASVNPYYGREIPGYEALGLKPDVTYRLLRDPAELAKAAASFERLPILSRHVPVTADAPRQDLIIGSIGSEVTFDDPYLDADLCFWDSKAIAGIETNTVRELSCAYRYVPVMTPGSYQGQDYDGIMTEIRGNHLALVEAGRAGSDVLAADEDTMKTTKLGKALIVTLGGMSPKLAQDNALLALVGQATGKTLNKAEVSSKLIAMDASLEPAKLESAFDALLALDGAFTELEEKLEKKGESKKEAGGVAYKEGEEKYGKKGMEEKAKAAEDEDEDEDEDEEKKKKSKPAEDVKGAMDSFKRELREAEDARRAVRPVVGDVIAQDSAAEIYGFALDHLKVDRKDVSGVPALRALFNLATSRTAVPAARIAYDSAGLAAKFPGATRFRRQ